MNEENFLNIKKDDNESEFKIKENPVEDIPSEPRTFIGKDGKPYGSFDEMEEANIRFNEYRKKETSE